MPMKSFHWAAIFRQHCKDSRSEACLAIEVGVADVLPRWIVYQLLEPALRLPEPIQLICHDDKTERLLSRLALNELDVVLTRCSRRAIDQGSRIQPFIRRLRRFISQLAKIGR